MYCKVYNVKLCVDFYELFHREPNIVAMKTDLYNKYEPPKQEKKTKN